MAARAARQGRAAADRAVHLPAGHRRRASRQRTDRSRAAGARLGRADGRRPAAAVVPRSTAQGVSGGADAGHPAMTPITGPAPQAPCAVDPQNPWPGLAAFEEGDHEFFKGRDGEVEALLRTILREDLTLFSSVSGLGKTSLLRAGLFPRLRVADIFPVYVRLRYDETAPPLAEQCFEEIRRAASVWRYEVPSDAPSRTVWEYVRRHDERFWSPDDRLATPILVFDQFEELFTHGRDKVTSGDMLDRFFADLSQALTGSPPAWLLARGDASGDPQHDYLYRPGVFKVLLSFREDYFA